MAHATGTRHNPLAQGAIWFGQAMTRMPVSLFLIAMITALAVANGSLLHHTDPAIIQRWGISWDNLARGRIFNLPISDLIVFKREHYITTLFPIVCYTGVVEWLGGSLLAALTFWPPSWIATFSTVILTKYLLAVTSWRPNPDLVHTADVGSSVGTWGSAGALIVLLYRFKPRLAWLAAIAFAVFLIGRFALHRSTADIAHIIGVTLGFLICRAYLARSQRPLSIAE